VCLDIGFSLEKATLKVKRKEEFLPERCSVVSSPDSLSVARCL